MAEGVAGWLPESVLVLLVYLVVAQPPTPAHPEMLGQDWGLLINKSVQRELRLTPDQITKVQARIEKIGKEKEQAFPVLARDGPEGFKVS